ncbi:hypothetical protein BT69DRAFT_1277126 [Atractiella rhizophila]|nr:hypothetical protein BT69DRAFT_1277126 [Atractiella rhizophila]
MSTPRHLDTNGTNNFRGNWVAETSAVLLEELEEIMDFYAAVSLVESAEIYAKQLGFRWTRPSPGVGDQPDDISIHTLKIAERIVAEWVRRNPNPLPAWRFEPYPPPFRPYKERFQYQGNRNQDPRNRIKSWQRQVKVANADGFDDSTFSSPSRLGSHQPQQRRGESLSPVKSSRLQTYNHSSPMSPTRPHLAPLAGRSLNTSPMEARNLAPIDYRINRSPTVQPHAQWRPSAKPQHSAYRFPAPLNHSQSSPAVVAAFHRQHHTSPSLRKPHVYDP